MKQWKTSIVSEELLPQPCHMTNDGLWIHKYDTTLSHDQIHEYDTARSHDYINEYDPWQDSVHGNELFTISETPQCLRSTTQHNTEKAVPQPNWLHSSRSQDSTHA
jgi:hypothetical protein